VEIVPTEFRKGTVPAGNKFFLENCSKEEQFQVGNGWFPTMGLM
jgi:hypothetical protein